MRPSGKSTRGSLALTLLGVILLAAGVVWVAVVWAREGALAAGTEASPLSAVLGATGVAATMIGAQARRRTAALRPATGEQVGQAAAILVELVREQLLLELLPPPDAAPIEPVPVLFSLVGWDPAAQPRVEDWLTAQLNQTYPALRAIAPDAAAALVSRGRVLPILDGLDEIAEARRPVVVTALNATLPSGLILTSRRPEYRAAVAAAGDVLTAAATIGPLTLSPAEAAAYLGRHLPPDPGPGWTRVLTTLRAGSAALATVTATPFGLWLLRTVYVGARRDPVGLVDGTHPTAADLRRHLIEQLIPAAVENRPTSQHRRRAGPFSARLDRHHEPDDLRRWLTTLAEQLHDSGSRDWPWWVLPRRVFPDRRARLAVGLATGVALLLLDGVVLGLVLEVSTGGSVTALLAAELGAIFGLPMAVMLGFVAARSCNRVTMPRHADFRCRGRGRELAGGLARYAIVGSLIAAPFALGVAPSPDASGSLLGTADGLSSTTLVAVLGVVAIALFCGGPAGATFGLMTVVGRVDAEQRASTPTASYRADRFVARLTMIGGALALGLTFAAFAGLAAGLRTGLLAGSVVVCWLGIPIAAAVGLSRYPSPAVVLATAWAALRGRLPWRLMPTLDDAYRLGLLRAVGPAYQFRHAELQDHLAPPAAPAVGAASTGAPAVVEPRGPAATA